MHFLMFLLRFVKRKILKCQSVLGAPCLHWCDAKWHKAILNLTWVCQFTPAAIEATSWSAPIMLCCPISATSWHCTDMSLHSQICGMQWTYLTMNPCVEEGTIHCEESLGKLALKVCTNCIQRGGLHMKEGMVKAASRDAKCRNAYHEVKNIAER